MSDGPRYRADLPRPQVRAALRRAGVLETPLQILAEDLLGADGSIDLVGVDPEGRVVVLLVGDEGADLEGVTRAIAQRAWVRPRLRDWLQLAPSLPVTPDAPVVAWLLCPSFRAESLAAAADLGPEVIELWALRFVQNGSEAGALVERVTPGPRAHAPPPAPQPTADPTSRFRSGLSQEDLGLTPEEVRDFE